MEARVRRLLQGDGGGWGEAPSPPSLAAAVRASHSAMAVGSTVLAASASEGEGSTATEPAAPGVIFPSQSAATNAAAANAAALESTMLFGRSGDRWLESVRLSARGALVLAAVTSAVYAAAPPPGRVFSCVESCPLTTHVIHHMLYNPRYLILMTSSGVIHHMSNPCYMSSMTSRQPPHFFTVDSHHFTVTTAF